MRKKMFSLKFGQKRFTILRKLHILSTYVFNEPILEFFPAFLAMNCVLLEDCQALQALSISAAQCIKVDELLAQEKFQQLP